MAAFLYDQLNSFGKLTAAGDFPNTIDLGEASIERMTVDLKMPKGAVTGGPLTATVKGSDSEGGAYSTIVQSGQITAAQLGEGYGLPVPKTGYRFIKAEVAGTFTGTVEALINSYIGK
ncbi:MAG: hypothetical protein LBH20_03635 [Treponema sp.]|jgi:hypothetical protein|nr:hypothetical protein [Treponema sp.]